MKDMENAYSALDGILEERRPYMKLGTDGVILKTVGSEDMGLVAGSLGHNRTIWFPQMKSMCCLASQGPSTWR